MKEVPITTRGGKLTGEVFLVDDADYPYVSQFRWHLNDEGYVQRTTSKGQIKLHRMLEHSDTHTRHVNSNKLDNQRHNLVPCGDSEQRLRDPGLRKNNTSGYRGVTFCKRTKLWHAQIFIKGKNKFLGRHSSPEEASRAYESEADKYKG